MLDTTLEDTFGKHYAIRQFQQSTPHNTLEPLDFAGISQAFSFISRLRVPHGYWLRTLSSIEKASLSSIHTKSTAGRTGPEHRISEYLYQKRLFIYELVNSSSDLSKRSIEHDNGDRYTFHHVSALLLSSTPQTHELRSESAAQALLSELPYSEKQLDELASALNLSPAQGGTSSETIIAALTAGEIIVSKQPKLNAPAEPEVVSGTTRADKPMQASPPAAASPSSSPAAAPEESPLDNKTQAATLEKAAVDGAPFCKECAKAKAA